MQDKDTDTLPTLKEVTKKYIVRVLLKTGGHQRDAALVLGLTARQLNYKMKKLGIPRPHDNDIDEKKRGRKPKEY